MSTMSTPMSTRTRPRDGPRRSRRRTTALLAAAVLGATTALTAVTPPAQAVFPGTDGKITYVRDGNIWTTAPNGFSIRLTSDGKSLNPRWSPDGTKITFNRNGNIHTMSVTGTNVRQLTTFGRSFQPAWNHTGTTIVFVHKATATAPGELWTVPATGGSPTKMTNDAGSYCGDSEPSWSSTGSYIVYLRGTKASDGRCYVYPDTQVVLRTVATGVTRVLPVVDSYGYAGWLKEAPDFTADGRGVFLYMSGDCYSQAARRDIATGTVTSLGEWYDCETESSPDQVVPTPSGGVRENWGTRDVFAPTDEIDVQAGNAGGSVTTVTGKVVFERAGNIWTIAPNGNGAVVRLTSDGKSRNPRFSPNGQQIVFNRNSNIFVMSQTGTNVRQLTTFGRSFQPYWSNTATTVVFVHKASATAPGELWTVPAAGGSPTRLTSDATGTCGKSWPAWSATGTHIVYRRDGKGADGTCGTADDTASVILHTRATGATTTVVSGYVDYPSGNDPYTLIVPSVRPDFMASGGALVYGALEDNGDGCMQGGVWTYTLATGARTWFGQEHGFPYDGCFREPPETVPTPSGRYAFATWSGFTAPHMGMSGGEFTRIDVQPPA